MRTLHNQIKMLKLHSTLSLQKTFVTENTCTAMKTKNSLNV